MRVAVVAGGLAGRRAAAMRRTLSVFAVAVLALVGAHAGQAAPWDGGPDVRSAVEQKLYEVGASYPESGGRFEYVCLSAEEWVNLMAASGTDALDTLGVVFPYLAPHIAWLSPLTCLGVERIMLGRNGAKMCQSGVEELYTEDWQSETYWTTARRQVVNWKRVWVKKNGKRTAVKKRTVRWKTVRVQRERQVLVRTKTGERPVFGALCSDWRETLVFSEVPAHETMHLFGVLDEAVAECFAMQDVAYWVWKLTGDSEFAKEVATDYWGYYQERVAPDAVYGSPDCYAGGPLDQSPADGKWPWSE
jgi:hypothetical protein